LMLGERDDTLLSNYHWRAQFIEHLGAADLL